MCWSQRLKSTEHQNSETFYVGIYEYIFRLLLIFFFILTMAVNIINSEIKFSCKVYLYTLLLLWKLQKQSYPKSYILYHILEIRYILSLPIHDRSTFRNNIFFKLAILFNTVVDFINSNLLTEHSRKHISILKHYFV